jgi:hypothetical protein
VRSEAEGTVQRLRQAQRRDTGLPFVDIIADTVGAEEPVIRGADGRPLHPNAAAAAAVAEQERALGRGSGGNNGLNDASEKYAVDEA